MSGIRIGSSTLSSISEALLVARSNDIIWLDSGIYSAPLLLASAAGTILNGSGSHEETILQNTPILQRSGQGKFLPQTSIRNLTFQYTNQSGYIFAPSIGSAL